MGVLDKIKLVEMARKIKPNAAQERRAKLGEQLHEQLKMAQAMLNGTTCERTKSTWAKDAEGNRVRVQKPVRMRAWWEVAGNAVQFGLTHRAPRAGRTSGLRARMRHRQFRPGPIMSRTWASPLAGWCS